MGHVVRETPWCVIDLNTTSGQIFLQQRWLYNWQVRPPNLPWTQAEKQTFHNTADRAIWRAWSNRATFRVSGAHDIARRFSGRALPINLDIRWVTTNHHWTVNATKIEAGGFARSNVVWNSRVINLDSEDINERRTSAAADPVQTRQVPVAHEFGHAAGNTAVLSRGDEYRTGHTHNADQHSIMNAGMQLRQRHFTTITEELNQMVPGLNLCRERGIKWLS